MEEEFNLSELMEKCHVYGFGDFNMLAPDRVKEFIKQILLDLDFLNTPDWREACARIEKRAGDKLT